MKLPVKILKAMQDYPQFYQKVWQACAQIPKGEVRSYGQIAKQVGRPGAARAVGQALARNPFAPTVPCHRVIGSDGRLTGFSADGGINSKFKMLVREGVNPRKLSR